MILITIIAFIVIFSIIVLVHEWGHFIMARKAGIKVEEFGVGLPPRAKTLGKDKKGMIYSLNWIPFGGFVRLYGEDSSDPKALKDKTSFASKTILQRTSVIIAGVVMNFVLAWALITIGFMVGMQPFLVTQEDLQRGVEAGIVETDRVLYVHEILEGSPLLETTIQPKDAITAINGQEVPLASELTSQLKAGERYSLELRREETTEIVEVSTDAEGKLGFVISDQEVVTKVKEVSYPVHIAPLKALQETGRLSVLTVQLLGDVLVTIVTKLTVPDGVAGPVGIAKLTHDFAQRGFMALMQFVALLSISLAVINIMPFPALDGGRLLFIIFELILRRRPNAKMESVIHATGFAILMLLIVMITWNDVVNLFT